LTQVIYHRDLAFTYITFGRDSSNLELLRLYWRWKSRAGKPGRPRIEREICDLIRRMSRENPTWGAPRILSELLLLGYEVAEATVAKYMLRQTKPPSQTWRTFLDNHIPDIAACDFFTIPTVTFRVLYVFIVFPSVPIMGETTASLVIPGEDKEVEGWRKQGCRGWNRRWWAERKEGVARLGALGMVERLEVKVLRGARRR
jgi:hypothetical protein